MTVPKEPAPAPFDEAGAAVPTPLQLLIYRCLAKRPEERFESFTPIVAELRQLFHAAARDAGNRGSSASSEHTVPAGTSAGTHVSSGLAKAALSSHNGGMADASSHGAKLVGAIYSPSVRGPAL